MNKFKIIIPVYNSEKWIEKCLKILNDQTYKNWNAVIINDASHDDTLIKIKKFFTSISFEDKSRYRVFDRKNNVGALKNIVDGIEMSCCEDEDIVILLDGDDYLSSIDVLEYLNQIYESENVWLTYGQYVNLSNNKIGLNRPLKSSRDYRKKMSGDDYWCTSHLRTFKYKIWKMIKDEDLKDKTGNYYSMAWDLAIMYPLIEMSGIDRIKFIDKVLYIYNDMNPINDSKKNVSLQSSLANEIKQKSEYDEIL